jgi:hypothetical protein
MHSATVKIMLRAVGCFWKKGFKKNVWEINVNEKCRKRYNKELMPIKRREI